MRADVERILAAFYERDVRYLVVGGLAVVLHGYLRTTLDLDVVLQLESENVDKAMQALKDLGYHPVTPVAIEQFADPAKRSSWIRDKNMIVFSLWVPDRPTFKLDIFVTEPFEFESTYGRAVSVELGTTTATIIGIDDLIAMKRKAGRPQDLADIEALLSLRDPPGEGA